MIEDLVDRLRLLRTPGIGPVTYRQRIRFGTPAAIPQAGQASGGRRGGRGRVR